ncbi:hypothetical protein JAAARDRAFT_201016 [Jaapia argillacea MUCL 33604]|uniref:Importin N-terminal domain-containing protein n=1 Tax=Jaapia argillacea MUCL 33604 TaxID=933084 RepID=A0A067P3A9_9AGAM|nr:hypothetical protein JAAARDRAFT_201016 [Jaapia argillacea MUCL 33604]
MADLPTLLLASLNPATRKQAEQSLQSLSIQPGSLSSLLQLVLNPNQDRAVRLAASVYLKNLVKNRWDDDETPLNSQDKEVLRNDLVPAMIALSAPTDKASRAQVAESVSLIAEVDFPERWPTLIETLVNSLSQDNYNINIAVLETAHSIFRRWRSQVRSDNLFATVNYVLERFAQPFLIIFRHTSALVLSSPPPPNLALLTQAAVVMVDLYYDLTCQDLPPHFEDAHEEYFGPQQGWFTKFLAWDPVELRGDPDDTTPSLPAQLKTAILEIAELYLKLYPEMLSKSASVEAFTQVVWNLLGTGTLQGVANDSFVSQSLHFISTAIRSGHYKPLFGTPETISSLVQGVVVPNVGLRDHEMEQFEDDPLEFIRQDLSLPSMGGGVSDATTRRQAAADVVRALVASGSEKETTEVVGTWIGKGLSDYAAGKDEDAWKAKDSAVYLLTAVATKGSTTQHGVTSTNALVDVVKFFSDHVFQDLQADPSKVHPMLQVDAIRFLYTFRNQLSKDQLLSVLPLLHRHLGSNNYVCYTYAAITIERILFIRQGTQLLFTQADVRDFAPELLNVLLAKIESAGSPEKVAENDHLMKCAMRVIITARQTLTPVYQQILQRLVTILGVISKNPSNPNFDQYIFESISALMRFVVAGSPNTHPTFEQALFAPITIILQQDIDQYIPYVFQILAQMLELHHSGAPAEYRGLLQFLLQPPVWQQKGNIPGLVKLLNAFLVKDTANMVSSGHFTAVLAVVQQRLLPSKLNDGWGFELLQAVVQNIPPAALKQYFRPVIIALLTRMQTSKTDKYVYHFVYFLMFTMAIQVEGLTPDYLLGTVEEVQPQLWSQVLSNFVIPQIPKMPTKDRKVVVVGLTRMLTQSSIMLREPTIQTWPSAFSSLVRLFHEPEFLTSKDGGDDPDAGITAIDYEEQTAGYQAAYSRLAASEGPSADPVGYVKDPREYLGQELVRLSKSDPRVRNLLGAGDANVVGPFVQALTAAGYVL